MIGFELITVCFEIWSCLLFDDKRLHQYRIGGILRNHNLGFRRKKNGTRTDLLFKECEIDKNGLDFWYGDSSN